MNFRVGVVYDFYDSKIKDFRIEGMYLKIKYASVEELHKKVKFDISRKLMAYNRQMDCLFGQYDNYGNVRILSIDFIKNNKHIYYKYINDDNYNIIEYPLSPFEKGEMNYDSKGITESN